MDESEERLRELTRDIEAIDKARDEMEDLTEQNSMDAALMADFAFFMSNIFFAEYIMKKEEPLVAGLGLLDEWKERTEKQYKGAMGLMNHLDTPAPLLERLYKEEMEKKRTSFYMSMSRVYDSLKMVAERVAKLSNRGDDANLTP